MALVSSLGVLAQSAVKSWIKESCPKVVAHVDVLYYLFSAVELMDTGITHAALNMSVGDTVRVLTCTVTTSVAAIYDLVQADRAWTRRTQE